MANSLGVFGQGLESFLTNTPIAGIQERDIQRDQNRADEMLALDKQRQAAMFQDARAVNVALKGGNEPLARRILASRLNDLT